MNRGHNSVIEAVKRDDKKQLKELLHAGANPNATDTSSKKSALSTAIEYSFDTVLILARAGAFITPADLKKCPRLQEFYETEYCKLPDQRLLAAADKNNLPLVKVLVMQYGANVNASADHKSVMNFAELNHNVDMIRFLTRQGVRNGKNILADYQERLDNAVPANIAPVPSSSLLFAPSLDAKAKTEGREFQSTAI